MAKRSIERYSQGGGKSHFSALWQKRLTMIAKKAYKPAPVKF
jgi:hypothetical protein